MRVLCSIIQALVLSVLYALEHLFLSRFVAFQFVGHDHPWHKALLLEKFAKKSFGSIEIPMLLRQNIENVALRIHRLPQVILLSFNRDDLPHRDATYLLGRGVCVALDWRIAAQT